MNNLQVFEGQQVEIIELEGEIMFELYSTGMALGQVKIAKGKAYPRKERIHDNIKNAEISTIVHNGQQYLTEEQLYDFMLEAKTDKCKKFRKWVTTDVLPSIRKHGAYMTENVLEQAIGNPDFMIGLLTNLKEEQEKRKLAEQKIEEQKPLVTFAETCIKSKDSILVRQLAKLACDEGINIGEKRLYNKLREWGLILQGSTEPTQYAMNQSYFEITQGVKNTVYGSKVWRTTKITPKGQVYIIEKLKNENK